MASFYMHKFPPLQILQGMASPVNLDDRDSLLKAATTYAPPPSPPLSGSP